MGTHPIFESDFDCLTGLVETFAMFKILFLSFQLGFGYFLMNPAMHESSARPKNQDPVFFVYKRSPVTSLSYGNFYDGLLADFSNIVLSDPIAFICQRDYTFKSSAEKQLKARLCKE